MIPVNEPLIAKNTLKYVRDCLGTGLDLLGRILHRPVRGRVRPVSRRRSTPSRRRAARPPSTSPWPRPGSAPGDEVIVPDLTMIAVPYAVLYTGAKPVLVDVDRVLFNMDPERVARFSEEALPVRRRRKRR